MTLSDNALAALGIVALGIMFCFACCSVAGCSQTVNARQLTERCELEAAPLNAAYALDIAELCTYGDYEDCPAHDALEAKYDRLYEEAAQSCSK